MEPINDQVRKFWERMPCGTDPFIVGRLEPLSREWFEAVEAYRYSVEPFIHSIAQFTRHRGKRVLEVGVGAGTDHLQWARAGAELSGVDLTDAAIACTRRRLETYGLQSNLQRIDAERLPFDDASFDIVYSWGVIHHSEHPERIIAEIHRVLKPGGRFIGMLYQRRSLTTYRNWVRHALLKGRPWRSLKDVLYHNVESIATKAYSRRELRALFAAFDPVRITPLLTEGDTHRLPRWLVAVLPQSLGWFLAVEAEKK